MSTYLLAGNRPGWCLDGLVRTDRRDGYSEFRDSADGVKAVIKTAFLGGLAA